MHDIDACMQSSLIEELIVVDEGERSFLETISSISPEGRTTHLRVVVLLLTERSC